jgi:hypothetical protein
MKDDSKRIDLLVGLAIVGGSATGLISFIAGIVGLFTGQLAAAGACLTACALSFGFLTNALLRK